MLLKPINRKKKKKTNRTKKETKKMNFNVKRKPEANNLLSTKTVS